MNRDEVIDALERSRSDFLALIDGLEDEDMLEPMQADGWSIKDIMVHICLWEGELVRLLYQAKQGEKPTTIHFKGIDVDAQNKAWGALMQSRDLDDALEDFEAVRKQTYRRVMDLSDAELTDPKRFSWQKNIPLWKWVEEDSFGHEDEHVAQIRAWLDSRPAKQAEA